MKEVGPDTLPVELCKQDRHCIQNSVRLGKDDVNHNGYLGCNSANLIREDDGNYADTSLVSKSSILAVNISQGRLAVSSDHFSKPIVGSRSAKRLKICHRVSRDAHLH